MKRKDGQIEMTRDEVEYLWSNQWGEMPEGLTLQKAAEAILLQYGPEGMMIALAERELRNATVCMCLDS